jgi:hypothetical protein
MRQLQCQFLAVCCLALFPGLGIAQEIESIEGVPTSMATNRGIYAVVPLKSDLSSLSEDERQMVRLLIDASKIMDDIFWMQSYGERSEFLNSISDPDLQRFAEINYGPWDRLNDNLPFLPRVGPKPLGANFYPPSMTKQEFEQACLSDSELAGQLRSLYTLVRKDADGKLSAVPYHVAYARQVQVAAGLLDKAAELATSEEQKSYLTLRAEALRTDDYRASDMAWMAMKDNTIDVVIGPIENYEDKLFGYKAAHEGYVLVKDLEWSSRLSRYITLLPGLQKNLPVPDEYKTEKPGLDSDLNAYDVVYYAGDCNSGSKTIAINLPNDEQVQLEKGTRRLQLKNAMRAKFDNIMLPISETLLAADQRPHVTFDAFFANTMFHEVAHGLGIKYTVSDQQSVRESLRDVFSALEEGKADILGLNMITELLESGELTDGELMDYYATFLAGIFRSVRFGAASAHGQANMIRFNYFAERNAFAKTDDGLYRVVPEKMKSAVTELSRDILMLQGDGDYDKAAAFVERYGSAGPELIADLDRLSQRGIPVDVVFEQGRKVLGL